MTGCPVAPYVEDLATGDLTGSSKPDAVAIVLCTGTGPGPEVVEVYRQAEGSHPPMRALLIPSPRLSGPGYAGPGPFAQSVSISGHSVIVESSGYAASDQCSACASIGYLQTFHFAGTTFTASRLAKGRFSAEVGATVWAQDRITGCASHAYGSVMVSFLNSHPCTAGHRLLITESSDSGRRATISIVTISFRPGAGDLYGYDANLKFQDLENASDTGSMNDLLREGTRVPSLASKIPAHEAFLVTGQDAGAVVFDAWWTTGATTDQDPTLLEMENSLFLTTLTPFS
jgi:hypothetical protein